MFAPDICFVFIFQLSLVSCRISTVSEEKPKMSVAVEQIIEAFTDCSSYNFLTFYKNNESFINDISDVILKSVNSRQKIKQLIAPANSFNSINQFDSIIIAESAAVLAEAFYKEKINFKRHFIIVLFNGNWSSIKEAFELFISLKIFNFKVLVEYRAVIILISFDLFKAKRSCNDKGLVISNTFAKSSFQKNIKKSLNIVLKDLKFCSISIATFDNPPFVISKSNRSSDLKGSDVEIVKTIAKELNFNPIFSFIPKKVRIINSQLS